MKPSNQRHWIERRREARGFERARHLPWSSDTHHEVQAPRSATSHPRQNPMPFFNRIILQGFLKDDAVEGPLPGAKAERQEVGLQGSEMSRAFAAIRSIEATGQKINRRDGGALPGQEISCKPGATAGVENPVPEIRCHSLQDQVPCLSATQDQVLFQVVRRMFAAKALPKSAGRPLIQRLNAHRGSIHRTTPSLTGAAPTASQSIPIGLYPRPLLALLLGVILVGALACGAPPAPPQPIAFDHSRHAEKGIGCLQCHEGANKAAQAGLPALATCASCHRGVIPDHPEIQKVLVAYDNKEPFLWRKVNVMPTSAMVHFKHKPHARAGVVCRECHGEVEKMTVARRVVNTADMGFCVQCHRKMEASTDCLACHH